MSQITRITFSGATPSGATLLFNSRTAFAPGQSLHLLGQQWFQYEIAADAGTLHTVTAQYTNTPIGQTAVWVQFYTSGTIDLSAGALAVFMDEIYIAPFTDVRVFWNVDGVITDFRVNMGLMPSKQTSQAAAADTIGGQTFPQTGIP